MSLTPAAVLPVSLGSESPALNHPPVGSIEALLATLKALQLENHQLKEQLATQQTVIVEQARIIDELNDSRISKNTG